MANKGRFGPAAVEGVVAQALNTLLSVTWVYIVAHGVSAADMGQLLYVLAVNSTAMAVFSLGLHHAFAVQARSVEGETLAANALAAIVAMGGAAAAACLFVQYIWFDEPKYWPFGTPVVPLIVLFSFVQIFVASLLRAFTAFRRANLATLSLFVFFNGWLILSTAVMQTQLTLSRVLGAYAVSAGLGALVAVLLLIRTVRPRLNSVGWPRLKALFQFGGRVHVGSVLKEIMYRADLYLVGALTGAAGAGLYGVVLRLIEAAARFVDAVGLVLVPMIARGDEAQRRRLSLATLGLLLPIAAMGAVIACAMAPLIVDVLFGPEFRQSAPLLRIAVFALIPLTIWKILANDLIARSHSRSYVLSALVGAVFIIIANAILLPIFGLSAAAIVLNAAYWAAAIILMIVARRRLDYRLSALISETGTAVSLLRKASIRTS